MDDAPNPAPAGWLESLARSEAQIAAGQIVSGEQVMREIRESIARLETKHAKEPKRRATRRR
jgi:ribosomal protein L29